MRVGKTLEGTPWASAPADVATNSIFGTVSKGLNAGGELTDLAGTTATAGLEAGEYATGVGELKLGYDALTYFGSLIGCGLGVLH